MKIRAGDILNGKYEVERHLAKGGMGSIWIARDLKLCRRVAVKFIEVAPADADGPALLARFEREALAVARLNTPHVVQVYDHELDAPTPYIVMEYLEGEDLSKLLAREKRLAFPAAVAMMNQVARGLRAAHEAGIVHRDLKPANIFLAEVDHEQVVKILDFGIAKLLDHRGVTADGEIFGSARYMSPEQVAGAKDLDLRSDLWSLGVILYRALTGADAFGSDIVETMLALRLGEFTPASVVAPYLVPEVDAFFERALAVDRSRRFLSAVEMAEAFAETAELQVTTVRKLTASTRQLLGEHAVTTTVVLPISATLRASVTNETERLPPAPAEARSPSIPPDSGLRSPSIPPDDWLRSPSIPPGDHLAAPAPPLEEETFSATARETRFAPHGKWSRVALAAVAVLALVGVGFALRTTPEPVSAGDAAAPRPAPSAPRADGHDRESAEAAAPAPKEAPLEGAAAAPTTPSAAPEAEAAKAVAEEEPAPSASAAAPAPRPWVHAAASIGVVAPHVSPTTRPSVPKPSCNPPYTVDPDGTRHVIRACL